MTLVQLLAIFGTPFALIGGAAIAFWWTRGGHYTQRCPATAYPNKPETCSCSCKPCKAGNHPSWPQTSKVRRGEP